MPANWLSRAFDNAEDNGHVGGHVGVHVGIAFNSDPTYICIFKIKEISLTKEKERRTRSTRRTRRGRIWAFMARVEAGFVDL